MRITARDATPLAAPIRRITITAPIALWLVDLSGPCDPHSATGLSRTEQNRADRFLHDVDRNRYLSAHAALRAIVERHWHVPPSAQDYRQAACGGWSLADRPFHSLSLSYARDHALIGLARAHAIGVDLEVSAAVQDVDGLALSYLSATELAAYRRLDPVLRNTAFLQAWTRKEACTKALGLGLHAPLQALDVGIDDARRTILSGGHQIELDSFPAAPGFVAAWARIR